MARAATNAARKARSAPPPRGTRAASARAVRRPATKTRRRAGQQRATRRPALATGGASATLPLLRSPFARTARLRGVRVLDALLSGRGWIALVFVLLAGIVFFNVDLLQLNREIAAGADHAADLKRANGRLRLQVARLGSSERIQQEAAVAGFVLPAPGDVRYLTASGSDPRRALKLITAPTVAPIIPPPAPAPIADEPVVDPEVPVEGDPAAETAPVAEEPVVDPVVPPPATTEEPAPAPVSETTGAVAAPPAE